MELILSRIVNVTARPDGKLYSRGRYCNIVYSRFCFLPTRWILRNFMPHYYTIFVRCFLPNFRLYLKRILKTTRSLSNKNIVSVDKSFLKNMRQIVLIKFRLFLFVFYSRSNHKCFSLHISIFDSSRQKVFTNLSESFVLCIQHENVIIFSM